MVHAAVHQSHSVRATLQTRASGPDCGRTPTQRGQLGHGDLRQRNVPTVVAALKGHTSVAGAGGKNHSAVVTSAGDSWAFGLNSSVRRAALPPRHPRPPAQGRPRHPEPAGNV